MFFVLHDFDNNKKESLFFQYTSRHERRNMDNYLLFSSDNLNIFKNSARVIVSGFSYSGKSVFISNLIRKYAADFDRILIFGVKDHPLLKEPEFASKITLNNNLEDNIDDNEGRASTSLLIYDDMSLEVLDSPAIANVFTKGRHAGYSVIIVLHNLFQKSKFGRIINLNTSHYCLFRQRDLNQVETLARQIFGRGKSKKFISLYEKCVLQKQFGYLVIDLSVTTPDKIRKRSNVANEEEFEVVYES